MVPSSIHPFLVDTPPGVHMTVFADGMSLDLRPLQQALASRLQEVLDYIISRLESVGLSLSQEKATYIVFPGNRRRAEKVPLLLGREPIRRVFNQRFFGLYLDSQRRWRFHAYVIADSCVAPLNDLRRICCSTWGNLPDSLIRLHSALVDSRMLYVAPFSHLAPT